MVPTAAAAAALLPAVAPTVVPEVVPAPASVVGVAAATSAPAMVPAAAGASREVGAGWIVPLVAIPVVARRALLGPSSCSPLSPSYSPPACPPRASVPPRRRRRTSRRASLLHLQTAVRCTDYARRARPSQSRALLRRRARSMRCAPCSCAPSRVAVLHLRAVTISGAGFAPSPCPMDPGGATPSSWRPPTGAVLHYVQSLSTRPRAPSPCPMVGVWALAGCPLLDSSMTISQKRLGVLPFRI